MAIKKEEFQALLEREGVDDFIWARSYKDIEGTNIGLYEMANDRWGCVFKIFPPIYAGVEIERRLGAFFNSAELPDKSSIQFFAFASRNLTGYRHAYRESHKAFSEIPNYQLDNKDLLSELKINKEGWLKKHSNANIIGKGNDLRLRNFVNLVCITVPRKKREGIFFSESELVSMFSKIEQGLNDFRPLRFTGREWVAVLREILIPDQPMWYPPEDNYNTLNTQVVDSNSILHIEEDVGTIGIGHMLNKNEEKQKRYSQLKSSLQEDDDTEDEIDKLRDQSVLAKMSRFFSDIFSKKDDAGIITERKTKWHAKVFTTKMFPQTMSIYGVNDKFYDFWGNEISPRIPCPFFLSMCVYYENREKIKKEVDEKVKWNLWQTQSLGSAARFFPAIVERAKESELVNQLLHQGESPIYASWCCVLMDDDPMKVNEYGEILKKKFLEDNWVLQEETLIQHWLLLYHLPLNFEPYVLKHLAKRMNTMFSANLASITPFITGEKGFGAPVLTYVDRGGQVSGADIYATSTNYNFIVVGASGSGKSFAMADFFTNYLMAGAKIRVIDVGRSYASLCQLLGGQYIEFTEDSNLCLNFFTNIQTKKEDPTKIHEDELQTLVPLVALMAMQSVSPKDAEGNMDASVLVGYISEAITSAFSKKHRSAGMREVCQSLEDQLKRKQLETNETDSLLSQLITALYPFGNEDGEYFKYFNGTNNLKFNSEFVVLELEELDKKEQLKLVVLAAISHIIQTEFFMSDRSQKKILAVDEAWSIMDNKVVVRFLETAARRTRKYNGASGIITQGISDFEKNPATRAIFDTSEWKFFFQQNQESIVAAAKRGSLNFDQASIDLMKTIKAQRPYYSEVFVKNSASSFIGRVIVDRLNYWIYTNNPSDRGDIEAVMKKYGVLEVDARVIIGYSYLKNTSIEEEYKERRDAGILRIQVKNRESGMI
ncbi:TraC family protein [Campylobacter sp. MOP7]|uniref:TraG/VirB4 family ATPase n=1 Tax=Campylobacter canis TaxID=3378588 RepID=UPI00387E4F48